MNFVKKVSISVPAYNSLQEHDIYDLLRTVFLINRQQHFLPLRRPPPRDDVIGHRHESARRKLERSVRQSEMRSAPQPHASDAADGLRK